jgi:Trk K+ transport system NAD-binding subunit
MTLRATSSAIGKPVSKLQDSSARISGLIRNGDLIFPLDDTVLEMGDELFILGAPEAVEKVVSEIDQES